MEKPISVKQLARLPIYLKYLKGLKSEGITHTSAPQIAAMNGFNEEQVRKDLQIVTSNSGKPKTGRQVQDLIDDLENYLGYRDSTSTVIVGVGHLGSAFMNFNGFEEFGLNILAGFDIDPNKIGTRINGKEIFSIERIENLIPRLNVHIAILCTPTEVAQEVCDRLINSGVKAIWNFAPTILKVNENVIVENVNLASSLAVLSHKLNTKLKED
ncbi:MAG: redox-sensing transcriptional repressor Rex [Bacilli bacterium]